MSKSVELMQCQKFPSKDFFSLDVLPRLSIRNKLLKSYFKYVAPFVQILFILQHLVFELIYNRVCPIYISEISDLLYTTKCTLSWNKKRLQNKSEISDFLCTTNYILSWTKNAYKISWKFPTYSQEISDLIRTTKYTLSRNKKRLQNKLEISDLFCERFLFQLRVHFVIHTLEISDLFCKRFLFQLRVHFDVYKMLEIYDIYIEQILLLNSRKTRCYKINNIFTNGATYASS